MKSNILIGLDLKSHTLAAAGIGRYTINLVDQLLRRNKFPYLGFSSPACDLNSLNKKNVKLADGTHNRVQSTYLRSLLLLPYQIGKHKIRLFHSMDNSSVFLAKTAACKRIATIHDLIVFKFPEFFTKKHQTVVKRIISHAVNSADHLITVSHSTKKDIIEMFPGVESEKISVTHLAASQKFRKEEINSVSEYLESKKLPSKYFLSLGTREPRKNHKNLIKAFLELKKESIYRDLSLIIAGGKGWLEDYKSDHMGNHLRSNDVFVTGYIEDSVLPTLYSGALAFIYPSFYEGFGLPVLEAMSCGCPIITSNISSLPEVAGKSAVYVNPNSIGSIKKAMEALYNNRELCAELSSQATVESQRFSWATTAAKTEAIYLSLLK